MEKEGEEEADDSDSKLEIQNLKQDLYRYKKQNEVRESQLTESLRSLRIF